MALQGLDLTVNRGEIFGFLGPNGAGKTTAIKILVGLLKPDSGHASLLGKPAGDVGVRQQIAYLPELPNFYDYLRPAEFLLHCADLSGLDKHNTKKKIPELLKKVGLDPAEKRHLRKFSKGMLQRIGLAQAIMGDPDRDYYAVTVGKMSGITAVITGKMQVEGDVGFMAELRQMMKPL